MQEQTQREGDRVAILTAPQPQAFVRHQASYYQAGKTLLAPGTMLRAAQIAVLAAAQCNQLKVYRRPRVAIISTALVTQTGAEPIPMGIVPDRPLVLQKALSKAIATADVVLSSGGVSVGDYDYVEEILTALGAEMHVRAVAMKPGKPLTVAKFSPAHATERKPVLYFGLPGNPVSALVCFWRFIQPALRKLSGLADNWGPVYVRARSRQDLSSDGKRETYIWGQLHLIDGYFEFQPASGSLNSGNLINFAQANGLAIVPVGQTAVTSGKEVKVLQFGFPIMS